MGLLLTEPSATTRKLKTQPEGKNTYKPESDAILMVKGGEKKIVQLYKK